MVQLQTRVIIVRLAITTSKEKTCLNTSPQKNLMRNYSDYYNIILNFVYIDHLLKSRKFDCKMRVALLLIITCIMNPSPVSSLENPKFVDFGHGHQFTTNSYYEEILEELNGAHLRFAASHVSLYDEKLLFLMSKKI